LSWAVLVGGVSRGREIIKKCGGIISLRLALELARLQRRSTRVGKKGNGNRIHSLSMGGGEVLKGLTGREQKTCEREND